MLLSDALVVDVAVEEKSARAALCMFQFGEKVQFLQKLESLTDVGRDLVRARAPLWTTDASFVFSVVHVPARLFVFFFFRGARFDVVV